MSLVCGSEELDEEDRECWFDRFDLIGVDRSLRPVMSTRHHPSLYPLSLGFGSDFNFQLGAALFFVPRGLAAAVDSVSVQKGSLDYQFRRVLGGSPQYRIVLIIM